MRWKLNYRVKIKKMCIFNELCDHSAAKKACVKSAACFGVVKKGTKKYYLSKGKLFFNFFKFNCIPALIIKQVKKSGHGISSICMFYRPHNLNQSSPMSSLISDPCLS